MDYLLRACLHVKWFCSRTTFGFCSQNKKLFYLSKLSHRN
jgi:hypothetical protein